MKCVCASLNTEKTILAYTAFRRRNDNDSEGLYESFLVEIEVTSGSNRFLFNVKGTKFQSIQV